MKAARIMAEEQKLDLSRAGLLIPTASGGVTTIPEKTTRDIINYVETPAVVQHATSRLWQDLVPASRAHELEERGQIPDAQDESALRRVSSGVQFYAAQSARESFRPGVLQEMIAELHLPSDALFKGRSL